MKTLISAKLAANIFLAAMSALAVFHVLVLVGILPSGNVWGGRTGDSSNTRVVLETTALLVTLVFALIIAAKVGYVRVSKLKKAVNIAMWVVSAYFTLNIIGNLASSAFYEKLVFTPVSLVLAALAWRLAVEK